jgi:hypothetical protein
LLGNIPIFLIQIGIQTPTLCTVMLYDPKIIFWSFSFQTK